MTFAPGGRGNTMLSNDLGSREDEVSMNLSNNQVNLAVAAASGSV